MNNRMGTRRAVALCAAWIVLLTATGCGSRLSRERLVAAANTTMQSALLEQPPVAMGNPDAAAGDSQPGLSHGSQADAPASSEGAVAEGSAVRSTAPSGGSGRPSSTPAAQGTKSPTVPAGAGPAAVPIPAGSGPGTPGSGPPGVACGTPKSPLVIGTVGTQSGVVGAAVGGGPPAVQAWAAALNAGGGLKCHPVKYIIGDDGGDPARHRSLVRQIVEDDHAIAFVGMNAVVAGEASVDYLTQKRIPVVGDGMASEWFYKSPMFFPQLSAGDYLTKAGFAAASSVGKAKGTLKLATISCIEGQICSNAYHLAPEYAKEFGLELVYRAQVSIVAPDYTSNCQSAKSAGAQLLFLGLDTNSIDRVTRSCNSLSYKPQYVTCIACIGNGAASARNPLLDGTMIGGVTIPWTEVANPSVAQYHAVLKRFAPGRQPDGFGMAGWIAAQLFQLAAQQVSETPTPEEILKGLWSIKANDLGGLTQPLTFNEGQPAPRSFCYWIIALKDGKYASPDEGKRRCP